MTATLCDVRCGATWITLNQPERRNALSDELVSGLLGDLRTAIADDSVRSIVITGAGKAFCAGPTSRVVGSALPTKRIHSSRF